MEQGKEPRQDPGITPGAQGDVSRVRDGPDHLQGAFQIKQPQGAQGIAQEKEVLGDGVQGGEGAVDLDRPVVICLFDRGTDDITAHAVLLRNLLRDGYAAFVLDTAGIGKCAPASYREADIHGAFSTLDTITKNLFFLGDSLCALRLFDLERALEVIRTIPHLGEVSLCARGNSGILARLFELLHPEIHADIADSQLISDIVMQRYYEEYDLAGFMLPGIAPYAAALEF